MIWKNLTKLALLIFFLAESFNSAQISEETGTVASFRPESNGSSVILGNKKLVETKSESATAIATHASKLNSSFLSTKNYKSMQAKKTPASLEVENDSSEKFDSSEVDEPTRADFDGLTLTQTRTSSSESFSPMKTVSKNVYKVPRHGAKKTEKSFEQSARLQSSEQFFKVFASLFDHFAWNIQVIETSQCSKDVGIYLSQLKLSTEWATKMTDASGRYRGLYLFENDYWLGSKQFCDEIDNDYEGISLQFFVVNARVHPFRSFNSTTHPRILHIGQCLPKSCTTLNIAEIMNNDPALKTLNGIQAGTITLTNVRAVPGHYNILEDKKFYYLGFVLVVTALLVTWATIFEYSLESKGFVLQEIEKQKPIEASKQTKRRQKEVETCEMNSFNNNNEINFDPDDESALRETRTLGFMQKALLCFAYQSNSKVILSTRKSSKDSLTCIHGLRLFSLLWTVMVHTYLQVFGIGENRFNRKIAERTLIYQVVGNATYSVDTFFFISGLLVVLLFLRTEQSKKKKAIEEDKSRGAFRQSVSKSFLMIFYRFLRLTPTYIIIIVFTGQAMKFVYNGSVFAPALTDHVNCAQYWWRNILYINNFYPLHEICMMWSWYLANDFQFYVITVFLLVLSTRYLKLAVFSSGLLLSLSWIFSIYLSVINKYTHKVAEPFESFDFLYDKPWQRFGPYAMGMATGYILYRFKTPPKISSLTNAILWLLSLANLCVIVFGVPGGQLSIFATSLYVSLGHTAWGLSLCWVTLSCCWNMARPVNNLLSYGGFLPLSRLTYCAYLIHPTIMMMISFQFEGPMHLKHGMVFITFLGNSALSFIVAYVISIMFEAPVIRFLKLCFRK